MTTDNATPSPDRRPKFWRWYRERDLSPQAVGEAFGRSREWVRLITLPFEDEKRRVPDPEDVQRIHDWTGGEVGPSDWYPPELSVPRTPMSAEASS